MVFRVVLISNNLFLLKPWMLCLCFKTFVFKLLQYDNYHMSTLDFLNKFFIEL